MNRPLSEEELKNLSKILGYLPDQIKREYTGDPWRTHGDITKLLIDRLGPAVAEQINGLLLNTYRSPFTGFVLPLRRIGDDEPIAFRWNTYTFEMGIADEIEQEGLARLHSNTKTEHGARMVRRGLAVKIEENFYRTPEGMMKYRQQIEQMATSILRTHELDIMLSLLQSPAVSTVREKGDANQIYGLDLTIKPDERLKRQIDNFGMVNKNNDMGFTNLTAYLIGQMKHKGVEPDCIIVPPNLINYYYATNPSLINYNKAGSSSSQARDIAVGGGMNSNTGIRRDDFNGLRVVDTFVQRMTEGVQQSATELLTVPKQIGEYYPMLTRFAVEENGNFDEYSGKMRNIFIYDEDLDRIVRVDYAKAVEHCFRWDVNGNINMESHHGLTNDLFRNEGDTVEKWGQMSLSWLSSDSVKNVVKTIKNNVIGKNESETINTDLTLFLKYYSFGHHDIIKEQLKLQVDPTDLQIQAERKKMWSKIYNMTQKFASLITPNPISEGELFHFVSGVQMDQAPALGQGQTCVMFSHILGGEHFFNTELVKDVLVSTRTSPVDCLLAFLFLYSKITKKNILSMHANNVYVPIDFILARPYMTYQTSSAIIMKSGRATGETLVSQERFQMTTNVADRMLYANVMYYGKAIVKNPRNVVVAPNVFIQNYKWGTNTQFIKQDGLRVIQENGGLTKHSYQSILSFATKVNDEVTSKNVIDIRGMNKDLRMDENSYATAEYYNALLNIAPESIVSPWTNHQDYENETFDPNTICMLGHVEDSQRRIISTCTGHLGRITVDGIGMTRKPGMYGARAIPT
jgi:hypothetical protein